MAQGPGTKIVDEIDRGTRTVSGVAVRITENVWNGGAGSTWSVHRVADGYDLTRDGDLGEEPGDWDLMDLVDASQDECEHLAEQIGNATDTCACGRKMFPCPFCRVVRTDNDLILDHIVQVHGR